MAQRRRRRSVRRALAAAAPNFPNTPLTDPAPERLSSYAIRQPDIHPDAAMLDARPPSHSPQEHSVRWNVDVSLSFNAEVERFLATRELNFDDRSQLVRCAVLFVMDFIERLDPPNYASNVEVIKNIAIENSQSETRRSYLASIERSASEAYELVGMGMEAEAVELVTRILGYVRQLPPKSRWRKLYEAAIKTRYGHLFKLTRVASLKDLDHTPESDQLGR